MRNFNQRIAKITAGLAAALLAFSVQAEVRYAAQPRGSSVKIQGTSNAHDWEMKGTLIGGFVEFPGKLDSDLSGGKVSVKGRAFIPITSIHSEADHLPEVMERLMQSALKADDFKRIEFTLIDLTSKGAHTAGQPFSCDATGELSLAGVTNKITFPVTVEPMGSDKIKVSGAVPLKMTDYGVTPPAPNFGLGLMHCGNDVKIVFDWVLEERGH